MLWVGKGWGAEDLKAQVDVMGSGAPAALKQQAGEALVKAGKAAIPILIGSLGDSRVYETRDIANRMNLPPNVGQPKPVWSKITVGERCEKLLYRIITPAVGGTESKSKVISEQVLRVGDWKQWWAANQGKSLESIHEELKPLVEAYWKQHGTTQVVPMGGRAAKGH